MSAHGTIEFIQTTKPTDNYLILDKRISEDDRLSLEARAILVYLLGKPPTWRVIVTNLLNMTSRARRKAGKHVVYAAITELIEIGYMSRKRQSTGEVVYYVHGEPIKSRDYVPTCDDEPHSENQDEGKEPHSKNPNSENPNLENPPLVITDKAVKIEDEQGMKGAAPSGSLLPDFPASKPTAKSENRTGTKALAVKKSKEPIFDAMAWLLNDSVPEPVARDWLTVRKERKCANTATAFGAIAREGAKAGLTLAQTVTLCAERSWATFEAAWCSNQQRSQARGGSGGGWWLSDDATLDKAMEVGAGPARQGETNDQWRARIRACIDNGGKPPAPRAAAPVAPPAVAEPRAAPSDVSRASVAQARAALKQKNSGAGVPA